jgi:hypothetical protein
MLSGLGIAAWLFGYIVSVVTQDNNAQVIGLAWMFYIVFLIAVGNYVARIVESSIEHLEEVRARVDKELGEKGSVSL